MKNAAFATLLLSMIGLGHVARADAPAPAAASDAALGTSDPSAPPPRTRVLSLGFMKADDSDHSRAGFTLELSSQVTGSRAHLHAVLATGAMSSHEIGVGSFSLARVGVEARGQGTSIRMVGGIDLGLVRDAADHVDLGFYEQQMQSVISVTSVPRFGVELGQHFRMRAMLEAPITVSDGVGVAGLGLSLAAGVGF